MTQQEKRYQEFLERRATLIKFGIKNGFIKPYDNTLIENLRQFSYGGVPVSIFILSDELCNGNCYDSAALITLGFGEDDFCLVRADINSLKLNTQNADKEKHNHCFAERTTSDGKTFVYDTSLGAVFEKSLYYQIEEPVVTKVSTKQETQEFLRQEFLNDQNFVAKKLVTPIMLPSIEKIAKRAKGVYKQQLFEEIQLFKKQIDYQKEEQKFKEEVKSHVEQFGQTKF